MVEIDAKTGLCILIGNPVEHSLSPAIHNAAFEALGLNYVYLAFKVEDIELAVKGVRGLGIRGASVTIPHKVSVIPYLDELDELARWIGSVNTIVNENGKLIGSNSDAYGALKALEDAGVALKGAKVSVIGSGGASRAISFILAKDAGIRELVIFGIIEKEFTSLSREVEEKTKVPTSSYFIKREILERELSDTSLLINASPVGMFPNVDESPVPEELLREGLTVMDIVYNPRMTKLLKEAREKGAKTIEGLEMFLNQAVVQFELWTSKKAPIEMMRKVIEQKLGHT